MKTFDEMNPEEKILFLLIMPHPHLSGTQALGEEMRLVKHNWYDFSPFTKDAIRKRYDVEEYVGEKEVRVNLR